MIEGRRLHDVPNLRLVGGDGLDLRDLGAHVGQEGRPRLVVALLALQNFFRCF